MTDATLSTATFLFTDIAGSTKLLKSHREEYAGILADHHRLLRDAFVNHGGTEVDNQGDAFFVAFGRARDAVLAAVACQRALARHSWPEGVSVRVRMGLHTGEADLAGDRYIGLSVHRAARICGVAHGGQVLLSQTTAGLLDDDELANITLKDLGEYQIKDLARPVRLFQLEIPGLSNTFPPLRVPTPSTRKGRAAVLFAPAAALLAASIAAVVFLARDDPPPEVVANSLVRIDPASLSPTDVIRVGDAPDLVVSAGGYVWITHHVLRDIGSETLHDAGDRTLTRVNVATGEVDVVGGGLAPCGLTADPSGDVWVANCFSSGTNANVVRIDASTLRFDATWPVPNVDNETFYRGLTYGGGELWISVPGHSVAEIDPRTGAVRQVSLPQPAGALAWSEGYGDLWTNNFTLGTLTRLHTATGNTRIVGPVAANSVFPTVSADTVWVGDWSQPQITRVSAVGPGPPSFIDLPVLNDHADSYVWSVAAGKGAIWATTPRDHALWRINPTTNAVTRIPIPHLPSGVTADDDNIWVTIRAK